MQLYRINITSQQGFILLIVLLFMQICALLGLDAMEFSWINNRLSRLAWDRYRMTMAVNEIVQNVEQNVLSFPQNCVISVLPVNEIIKKPLSWWNQQSCAGNFHSIQYYYVLESLGVNSCAHIRQSSAVADYYRLTFLAKDEAGSAEMIVQSTLVKVAKISEPCKNKVHQVDAGRQSWIQF
jgi:Tfp pilus assembly protein PilX